MRQVDYAAVLSLLMKPFGDHQDRRFEHLSSVIIGEFVGHDLHGVRMDIIGSMNAYGCFCPRSALKLIAIEAVGYKSTATICRSPRSCRPGLVYGDEFSTLPARSIVVYRITCCRRGCRRSSVSAFNALFAKSSALTRFRRWKRDTITLVNQSSGSNL